MQMGGVPNMNAYGGGLINPGMARMPGMMPPGMMQQPGYPNMPLPPVNPNPNAVQG